MRMVAVTGSRTVSGEEAKAVVLEASRAFRAKQEARLSRRINRLAHAPERASIARAMFAIECRLVEALWTLARLPDDRGIGFAKRNGVGYLDERADLYANAVANGGWLTVPPKPEPPSGRAIDAMYEPLDWLRHLDRESAKLLSEGALNRRGKMTNNISWGRVRAKFPSMQHLTIRTVQRRYEQALRDLVALGIRA